MWIWNFAHSFTPFHVYELLAVVLMAAMAIAAGVHVIKNKKEESSEEQSSEDSL